MGKGLLELRAELWTADTHWTTTSTWGVQRGSNEEKVRERGIDGQEERGKSNEIRGKGGRGERGIDGQGEGGKSNKG